MGSIQVIKSDKSNRISQEHIQNSELRTQTVIYLTNNVYNYIQIVSELHSEN